MSISPALVSILRSARTEFNGLFTESRRRFPTLDGEVVLEVMRETISRSLAAVEQREPGRLHPAARDLFKTSLELIGRGLLGAELKSPWVKQVWLDVLPKLPSLLVTDAERCARLATNAVHQVSVTHGAKPAVWIEEMGRTAPFVEDFAMFELTAVVSAWRSGLAHLRGHALDHLSKLNPRVLETIFGVQCTSERLAVAVDALRSNPWLSCELAIGEGKFESASSEMEIRAAVGGFRGFGGLFAAPPRVAPHQDGILVADGELTWVITADCYGATFHSVELPPPSTPRPADDDVTHLRQTFVELGGTKSVARHGRTVAATVNHSHFVYLLAPA